MFQTTKARRLLFFGLMIVGTVVVIEAFSFVAYRVSQQEWPSLAALGEERRGIAAEGSAESTGVTPEADSLRLMYTLHPYLGYVLNPASPTAETNWWIHSPDPDAPFAEAEDTIHVVVVGGSVAFNLRVAMQRLKKGLRAFDDYRDKKIVFVTLAGLGYKQPQSLIAVNYYLALGGKIDLLICLDGINEIAVGASDVIRSDIYPHYPAPYSHLAGGFQDPAVLARFVEVKELRATRVRTAEIFDRASFSFTANLLWKLLDGRLAWKIYESYSAAGDEATLPLHSRGPAFDGGPNDDAVRQEIAHLWARSSRVLAELARGRGFSYFHFLQPNQYTVEAGRHLSPTDASRYAQNERFTDAVPRWYPELQKLGAELSQDGVAFYDMTSVYEGMTRTPYSDDCCHLSREGRRVLVDAMAERIVERLRAEKALEPGPVDAASN